LQERRREQSSAKLETEQMPQLETQVRRKAEVTAMLETELQRLKKLTGLGHQLTLVWLPLGSSTLSGEVKKNVVYVYDEEFEKALETLRHEFLDFLICAAIKPYEEVAVLYRAMLNGLLAKLGENAYLEKERAVEAISRILSRNHSSEKEP
jgi:hypothetical protein